MKVNLIRILKFILYLVCCFFIGIIISMGIEFIKASNNYTSLHFLLIVLIFIFAYFSAISVHEMAHFITFVKNGVSMSALYILFFLFIKEDNQWKLKIKPNAVTIIGGIAIPDFDYIKDKDHFKKLQRVLAKTLIWGPIASILLWVFNTLLFVFGYFFINNEMINTILLINFLSSSIITALILYTSTIKNDLVVGDFAAYKLTKNDEFFTAMQLYQSSIYSTNPEYVKKNNHYLRHFLKEILSERLINKKSDTYTLSVIDSLLIDYLAGNIKDLPMIIEDYIKFILNNDILSNRKDEHAIGLMFHIIHYLNENDREKTLAIYHSFKKKLNLKMPYIKFYIKQTEHILNLANHSHYLNQKENIVTSLVHSIYKHFNGYYIDHLKINRR